MPAEWERQESTLIAWPHNKNDWPGRFENIPDVFAQIISQISKVQKVKILIQHNLVKKNIYPLLRKYKAN
jgi:agmatine deiminase